MFNWFGNQFQAWLDAQLDKRFVAAGNAGVAEAKRLVPKDTHQTEHSIGFTYDRNKKLLQLHADTSWAVFLEAGTRFMPARPFLRPGLAKAAKVFGGGDLTLETQLLNTASKYAGNAARGYVQHHPTYRSHGRRGTHTHTFNFGQRHHRP